MLRVVRIFFDHLLIWPTAWAHTVFTCSRCRGSGIIVHGLIIQIFGRYIGIGRQDSCDYCTGEGSYDTRALPRAIRCVECNGFGEISLEGLIRRFLGSRVSCGHCKGEGYLAPKRVLVP